MKHNHMTRDIKAPGVCPACDRHREVDGQLPKFREALDQLPKVPEAREGDKFKGHHMACRLCTPGEVGDTVVGLCGAEYVLDGVATSVEVARENEACADCIKETQQHVFEVHPDLLGMG